MQNDDNKDQSFPGYPHYPAGEDITRSENNNGKEPLAQDGTMTNNATDHLNDREADTQMVSDTDADVTNDDLANLDAADQNMDRTDSNNLQKARLDSTDEDGDDLNEDDLDVPGSGADDADENIGEEDEENNYYSLGGDNHEGQEERQGD